MQTPPQIEQYTQTYYIKANLQANSIDLTIIDLYTQKLNKFTSKIEIQKQTPKLLIFDNCKQLLNLFKNPQNYIFKSNSSLLTLKFKIVCKQFQKQIQHDFHLSKQQLTEIQQLKIQNFILKKKISKFQDNNHKTNTQISNPKIIQITQEHSKINQPNPFQQDPNKINQHISQQEKTYETAPPEENLQPQYFSKNNTLTKIKKNKPIKKSNKLKNKSVLYQPKQTKKTKNKDSLEIPQIKSNQITSNNCEQLIESSSKQPKNTPSDAKVKINFINGDYYYGELQDNVYHGSGLYFSCINGTFDGQWKFGKANGYGISKSPSGNIHSGNYINDKRNGHGIDEYVNGERYQGNFQNDNKQGFGKYVYKNGDYYEGMWKNDFSHGTGKEYYIDGSYYQGIWFEDEKDGKGIFTNQNSQKFEQIWQKGVKISEKALL